MFFAQGWRQFLTSRSSMLAEYDKAREQSRSHKVEVFQGRVAEAEFRSWLATFLPKRYGVTSGYIISADITSEEKRAPHYDVIIYDILDSPVLWTEGSSDLSPQGRSLAIPAEYVRCVIEVKSQLRSSTMTEALKHLADLQPLMIGIDQPAERYKKFLPYNFFCAIVFFELRKGQEYRHKILDILLNGLSLRGFHGGVILRGQDVTDDQTGQLTFSQSETAPGGIAAKKKDSLLVSSQIIFGQARRISDSCHIIPHIYWARMNFQTFAFDIIALLNGTYSVGRASSFHAFVGGDYNEGN